MAYGSPERVADVPAYYSDIRGGRPIAPELLDDLVARREFGAAATLNHRELVAPAHAQVDLDLLAWGVEVLRAVPRRHLVGVGPGAKNSLARSVEDARDQDLLVAGRDRNHPVR